MTSNEVFLKYIHLDHLLSDKAWLTEGTTGMKAILADIVYDLWEIIKNTREDDPDDDCTDFAHPAYWRGEKDGVRGAVMRIRKVLNGEDDGSGVMGCEELEQLRRDILALVNKEKSNEKL